MKWEITTDGRRIAFQNKYGCKIDAANCVGNMVEANLCGCNENGVDCPENASQCDHVNKNQSNVPGKILRDFLREDTFAGELCVIREDGYIIATAYIDNEDLFAINDIISEKIVIDNEYGSLDIVGNDDEVKVRYIDIT